MEKFIKFFILLLYVISCIGPSFRNSIEKYAMTGFAALFLGPFALFYNFSAAVAWLSNIFLLISIILIGKSIHQWAILLAFIAFLMSIFVLNVKKVMVNEGGHEKAVSLAWGGYLWIFAIFLNFIFIYYFYYKK